MKGCGLELLESRGKARDGRHSTTTNLNLMRECWRQQSHRREASLGGRTFSDLGENLDQGRRSCRPAGERAATSGNSHDYRNITGSG